MRVGVEVRCLEVGQADGPLTIDLDEVVGDQVLGRGETAQRLAPAIDELLARDRRRLAALEARVVEPDLVGEDLDEPIPLAPVGVVRHAGARLDDLEPLFGGGTVDRIRG